MGRKILRTLLLVLLILTLLTGSFYLLVRLPSVQTFLAHRATKILSKSLGTNVSIDRVAISFFNKADLVNFYMEDRQHDTMIAAKELTIQFKVFSLIGKKISITDIFFDGAVLKLHRDSAGNTNIADVFKTFQATKPAIDKEAKKEPASFSWNIDLENLVTKNTYFRYRDEKGHLDLKVSLPTCNIAVKTLDLKKNVVAIKSFYLDQAFVSMETLKHATGGPADSNSAIHFLKGGPLLTFDEFEMKDSHFKMDNDNSDTILNKGMDFKHLDLTGINLLVQKGKIIQDTIFANIKSMAAKEHSGFVLENLTTNARVSVNDITLDKLNLKTPHSEVKDYLSFSFNSFDDFGDFFKAVKIRAKFSDTKLSLADLNFFIRKLDKVEHNTFAINGEINGSVSNLKGKNVEIRTGRNTIFKGDFATRGLPNIYETSLNLRIDRLATSVEDVDRIYPGLPLPVNLRNLGLIYYVGSFDGFITDFVSQGRLVTSIGSATTDVHFLYDKEKNKASYKGDVSLIEFDIGKYLGDQQLFGKVSLSATVNGKGLTPESLDAELDGLVSNLTFKGYDYKNIKVDGVLQKKSFDGALKIEDKNLDMDFDGRADLTNKIPEFRFKANVRKIRLKDLNLGKEDFEFSAKMESDFSGANIDDILGSVDVNDITIRRDTTTARVKHLGLNVNLTGKTKKIILDSDVADAEMSGNFNLGQLPKALVNFADYTFTRDFVDTSSNPIPQDFTLDFTYYEQPYNLTQIILPQLRKLSSSRVTCTFNSVDHKLNVTANIPEISYGAFNIRRANISSNAGKGLFDFTTSVERVYSNDSLILDSINLVTKKDGPTFAINLKGGDGKQYNYANISAMFTPLKGGALLRFDTSDVRLGNNNWHFETNDSIYVFGKKITTRNLVFHTNQQTIAINSYLKGDTSTSLKVSFQNTSIIDFTQIINPRIKDFRGIANGNIMIDDIFSNPRYYADIQVKQFTIGPVLIGDINVSSQVDSLAKNVHLSATVSGTGTDLEAIGDISMDPLKPGFKIDVNGKRVNLAFLNYRFFDKYVKDVHGYAIVNATVSGTPKKPLINGEVVMVDDTVTVTFTNTTYTLNHQKAKLDDHGFNLDGIVIHDLKGNAAYGSGRINHESFRDFALAIDVTTESAQFLNTTAQSNPGFYGIAYGKGAISFNGPINSPIISATATTGPGTWCKLPINSSYETNRYSFYRFTTKGKDNTNTYAPAPMRLNGVTFNLKLEVTPDARMDIILDPITGDILTAYGHGTLNIKIPKNSNMDLRGDYIIERGSYLFTLQGVITKHFDLDNGGTISFNGDINKAGLNLDAVYKVRSSVSTLIDDLINGGGSASGAGGASSGQLNQAALRQSEVDLLLHIAGILERPSISFDIVVKDPDPTVKTYVDQKLALLKNNETELYKQVFGLLVMNQFIPTSTSTQSMLNSNNISGTAVNTVSEFISSQFSNYLSNLLEFANVRNLDVNLGLHQYDQSLTPGLPTTTSTDTRTQLQVAFNQRLLNNRLSINAGGNLDMGNSTDPGLYTTKSVIPTGDFQIEYSLTSDGAWRAKAFNRTNYDYLNERNDNRTGVGISYHQEFDKPSELFRKKKKAPKVPDKKAEPVKGPSIIHGETPATLPADTTAPAHTTAPK